MGTDIVVDASLWGTSILPQGYIESWIAPEGRLVEAGDPIACIRIESALHELMSPATGTLHIDRVTNSVVEPGAVIGRVTRYVRADFAGGGER
jgi:hypothetical protein